MAKIIDTSAAQPEARWGGLSLPQVRVLQALSNAKGPLTRGKLSDRIGNKTDVVVGRAVGYDDPTKRAAFEQSKDGGFRKSLQTLGYVKRDEIQVEDGMPREIVYELTPEGAAALEALGELDLPPLKE